VPYVRHTVQYSTVQYSTVQYSTVQRITSSAVPNRAVQRLHFSPTMHYRTSEQRTVHQSTVRTVHHSTVRYSTSECVQAYSSLCSVLSHSDQGQGQGSRGCEADLPAPLNFLLLRHLFPCPPSTITLTLPSTLPP
jgi:hypothetical protein